MHFFCLIFYYFPKILSPNVSACVYIELARYAIRQLIHYRFMIKSILDFLNVNYLTYISSRAIIGPIMALDIVKFVFLNVLHIYNDKCSSHNDNQTF